MLTRGSKKGLLQGMLVGRKRFDISHFQFAKDIILFLPFDRENFQYVISMLNDFQVVGACVG